MNNMPECSQKNNGLSGKRFSKHFGETWAALVVFRQLFEYRLRISEVSGIAGNLQIALQSHSQVMSYTRWVRRTAAVHATLLHSFNHASMAKFFDQVLPHSL